MPPRRKKEVKPKKDIPKKKYPVKKNLPSLTIIRKVDDVIKF
jgi:hypothetical protein